MASQKQVKGINTKHTFEGTITATTLFMNSFCYFFPELTLSSFIKKFDFNLLDVAIKCVISFSLHFLVITTHPQQQQVHLLLFLVLLQYVVPVTAICGIMVKITPIVLLIKTYCIYYMMGYIHYCICVVHCLSAKGTDDEGSQLYEQLYFSSCHYPTNTPGVYLCSFFLLFFL